MEAGQSRGLVERLPRSGLGVPALIHGDYAMTWEGSRSGSGEVIFEGEGVACCVTSGLETSRVPRKAVLGCLLAYPYPSRPDIILMPHACSPL